MKKHIPNIITSCNLLSGAVAVWLATEGLFAAALVMIIVGATFDFCDGLSARALGVSSPIGKELDSLADCITFGLAPSMMLMCYLKPMIDWWALIALLMAAFSALRLAKFNLDERQTTSFIGLATPANALFWASAVSFLSQIEVANPKITAIILLLVAALSCYLLIAEIPFFSLKFHNLRWEDNKVRFMFLIGSALLLLAAGICAVIIDWIYILLAGFCIIFWYITLSLFSRNK